MLDELDQRRAQQHEAPTLRAREERRGADAQLADEAARLAHVEARDELRSDVTIRAGDGGAGGRERPATDPVVVEQVRAAPRMDGVGHVGHYPPFAYHGCATPGGARCLEGPGATSPAVAHGAPNRLEYPKKNAPRVEPVRSSGWLLSNDTDVEPSVIFRRAGCAAKAEEPYARTVTTTTPAARPDRRSTRLLRRVGRAVATLAEGEAPGIGKAALRSRLDVAAALLDVGLEHLDHEVEEGGEVVEADADLVGQSTTPSSPLEPPQSKAKIVSARLSMPNGTSAGRRCDQLAGAESPRSIIIRATSTNEPRTICDVESRLAPR